MQLKLSASVGKNGQNKANDVRLVKALLNTYFRSKNKTILALDNSVSDDFYNRIGDFQRDKQGSTNPDKLVSANANTFKALKNHLKSKFTIKSIIKPKMGIITWLSEGNEGGQFHSRKLHVPNLNSGLTIGRGYDMKLKPKSTIKTDLISVGIDISLANKVSESSGLFGDKAKQFIIDNDLLDAEILPAAQLALFNKSYAFHEKEVIRICKKSQVIKLYGDTNWTTLHQSIKEILIDLIYRGDYHGQSRAFLQKHVANNDFSSFKDEISNRSRWPNPSLQRFTLRKKFLEDAPENKYALKTCAA